MTAPFSECAAANIAHSCTICGQMVIGLDQNNQRHVLGRLDELLRQPGGENCELLRQYTAKSKAGPETGVELGVSRYRGLSEDLRAHVLRQGFNDDESDTDWMTTRDLRREESDQ